MSNQQQSDAKPEAAVDGSTVTQATGCYNCIGESNMYFFTKSSGQFAFSVKEMD